MSGTGERGKKGIFPCNYITVDESNASAAGLGGGGEGEGEGGAGDADGERSTGGDDDPYWGNGWRRSTGPTRTRRGLWVR